MKNSFNTKSHFALLLTALIFWVSTTQAIVIRHDVDDSFYTDLASNFNAVGRLAFNGGGGFCSGTLVATNKVLTASHCLTNINTGQATASASQINFRLGADSTNPSHVSSVSSITRAHALGNWSTQLDMAVLTLTAGIVDVPFMHVNPFLNPLGKRGTLIGYGRTGTGTQGGGIVNNVRRAAHNMVDFFGVNPYSNYPFIPWNVDDFLIAVDFDNPDASNATSTYGSSTPLALEGITDGGDSGSPLIVNNTIVGTLFGGNNPFDGFSGNEFYGDISVYASVQLEANLNFLRAQGVSIVDVSAPFVTSLLMLGCFSIWLRRRQDK